MRAVTRERHRLTKEQTAHTNRIKALLRLHGFAVGQPRRRDWLNWLAAQRDWQGQGVPPRVLSEIENEHARLMLVRKQLDALARTPAAADPAPAVAEMVRRSELLQRLKSLGPAFATTLTQEAFYKDFHNRRQVASYFGLAPSPWQSGGTDRDQGISKAGNPRARCSAIELSWLWLRHQPDSRAEPMVPAAHAQCRQAHQAHRDCGLGAQAGGGALALPHNRSCARRGGAQVGGSAMI